MSRYGPLEARVLEALWKEGEGSVRSVLQRLDSDHAYTTILTALDRLHTKGVVRRRKERGAWIYAARRSRDEVIGDEIARLLVASGHVSEALLASFLNEAETLDPAVLSRLEKLIRRRRGESV